MTNRDGFITKEEKKNLNKELKELKEVERPKAIEQLKVARSYGDLSENTEYASARERQGIIESRINEIEMMLKNKKVLREDHGVERVTLGNSVEVMVNGKEKKIFDIGKKGDNIGISPHSPVGEALFGKEVGDVVVAEVPNGQIEIKIVKIV